MNDLEYGTKVTEGIAAQVAAGDVLCERLHNVIVQEGVDGQLTLSCDLETRRGRHHISGVLVGPSGPIMDAETFVTIFVSNLIERLDMTP